MKTQIFKSIVLSTVIVFLAIDSKAEVAKAIHKSWPVNMVKSLAIENKFGNINFISTRNDSVTIDVSIDTDFSYPNNLRLANHVDFVFSLEGNKVKAKTLFIDDYKSHKEFTINYVINIPQDRALEVINKYGNVNLDDLKASGNFTIAYGNITGNNLQAPGDDQIRLDLKYGSANFEKINSLLAFISYSKLRTTSITNAELETRYSTIFAESIDDIYANSRYDNYTILKLKRIKADSGFTGWKIDEASSSIMFDNGYGDIRIGKVPRNFEKISIQNRYGNIRVGIASDASYFLNGEASYCNIIYPYTKLDKYIKDNNHTSMQGYIGNKNTTSKVIIESKYGKVDLME